MEGVPLWQEENRNGGCWPPLAQVWLVPGSVLEDWVSLSEMGGASTFMG